MLNRDCWNFNTISLKSFVTLTSLKNLKRIPTLFTKLYPMKSWKMSILPKHELNGTNYVLRIAQITLLRLQLINFSPELVVIPTRNMIWENRASSKKNLDVHKCCVSVATHNIVLMSKVTSTSLPAKVSIKKHCKIVVMVDQCQSIAKCWRTLLM